MIVAATEDNTSISPTVEVTAFGGTTNTSVNFYGISNVTFGSSYTYIMLQITMVDTSVTSTPIL